MGARINYVFKDSLTKPSVVLYSHWGETEWQRDLAMALQHSKPRWIDASYGTRMMISYLTKGTHRRITEPRKRIRKMISYLTQDSVLDETGFGIYAINNDEYEFWDTTVIIDFNTKTINELGSDTHVKWDLFVAAYRPVLMEQI
jgi:hypothetical protein